MQVRHGFHMDRDHVRARFHERRDVAVRFLDHQVHIERPGRDVPDRPDDRRPDRDVRHEVPVHHVDVNEIRAAAFDGRNVAAEGREVGGEDGGSDLNSSKGHRLTSSEIGSEAATWNPP